ncbi:MAG TPA: hypothetical protein VFC15_09455, partial [Candidatus Limnocylindrales bacterium]|nr:hypothetical protein [Candidatus Limnocylindrales bacterium]
HGALIVFDVGSVCHFVPTFEPVGGPFGDTDGGPCDSAGDEPIVKPIGVRCGNQSSSGTTSAGYNQYG